MKYKFKVIEKLFYSNLLYSYFKNKKDYLFLLMEFLNGGCLEFLIENNSSGLGSERTRFYAAEILIGIQFLHKKRIIHRDLKPGNILLDKNGHSKITDFGLCKNLKNSDERASTFCGTLDYIGLNSLTCI